jgi:hypothetical protein
LIGTRGLANHINWEAAIPQVMSGGVGLLLGIWLGTAQWFVLRQQVDRAGWWILASGVGWLLLGVIIEKSIDSLIDVVALGALPALVTGSVLVWLMQDKSKILAAG